MDKISTHLWLDDRAEGAASFYTGLFPDSRIDGITRAPADHPNGEAGDVLEVAFTLSGRSFLALNGGPGFPFTEAISLSIDCHTRAILR